MITKAHTIDDLKQLQAMPLPIKVAMTQTRIRAWVNEFGTDGVYVSFSGGKDSTVLLDIVRNLYPDIPGVFVDTGLEYPEIRDFVKTFDNITWLKPAMNFRQVIEKYGYPFFSKEVSHKFNDMYSCHDKGKHSYVDDQLDGTYLSKNGKYNMISIERFKFLKEAPFRISHKCCDVMKKTPTKQYGRNTGRKPFTAQMACESMLRQQQWLKYGCNAFEGKYPISNPMSFWTEQDVLQYIKENNLSIAAVYGDIVPIDNQITLFDTDLKTTGCNRTGCMFCGFGCHLEKSPNRFEKMKETHPKQYEYIMRDWDKGGLGYKKVIDWINDHGNMNIKY
jgi:3'-phosphoadenosine 5'-phosphosulfate sulfotransferase (PAPS reductase)/FAD synthetase